MARSVLRISGLALVLAAAMTLTGLPRRHPASAQDLAKDPRLQQLRDRSFRYIKAGLLQQVADTCERGLQVSLDDGDPIFAMKFLNNLGGAELGMFNFQAAI